MTQLKIYVSKHLVVIVMAFLIGCETIDPYSGILQYQSSDIDITRETIAEEPFSKIVEQEVVVSGYVQPSTIGIPALDLSSSITNLEKDVYQNCINLIFSEEIKPLKKATGEKYKFKGNFFLLDSDWNADFVFLRYRGVDVVPFCRNRDNSATSLFFYVTDYKQI